MIWKQFILCKTWGNLDIFNTSTASWNMSLLVNVFSKPEVQLGTLQINSEHSLVAISKMPNPTHTTRINSAANHYREF